MEIAGKIAQIRDGIERNIPQVEIDIQLEELKQTVKNYTQKANQRYSIEEVKAAVNRVKRINTSIVRELVAGDSNRKAIE